MIGGANGIDVALIDTYYNDNALVHAMTISAPSLAKTIKLSMSNDNKYIMTAELLNAEGSQVSKATLDLPLEEMVISGSYDEANKKIVLTLKNGGTTEIPVGDLVNGLVGAENNFSDAEFLIADGDGKKAKSSGYKILTGTDYGNIADGKQTYKSDATIPTMEVANALANAARAYPIPLATFKMGKDLYNSSHEDYDKLILSATPTNNIIGADSSIAKIVAAMCDKLFYPIYVSDDYGNRILTNIEFIHKQNTGESEYTTTIKIAVDHSIQEEVRGSFSDSHYKYVYIAKPQSVFFPSIPL